ncbi:nitroreductase family protein [Moraxella catarrhalis]|uniref:Putative nitroreductase n=1 Tax=Moraxella catarrhalis TaxID=480 RepID=A0A198UD91_MORCA|nr:nitroreductase family protein [Moraxella catarrhalis]OAU94386.1 putative nitroreductase [Moraxella catarrhalis]OAU94834.1 putative nitroreductase [Moraxella catarrhalis]OAV02727.1 putative nitroreductase [Moraxella catarrhalis]
MDFKAVIDHRRAVRDYDSNRVLDPVLVVDCLKLAQLSPSSSNMQLYEFYHITDVDMLKKLAKACLSQQAAASASQMVVFVTRQDKYAQRAKSVLSFERNNIKTYSPPERQASRIKRMEKYYGVLMPTIYRTTFGVSSLRSAAFLAIQKFKPTYDRVSVTDVRIMVHKSCALAAQTFMLAMSAAGADTCPMEGFDSKMVKNLLNLPEDAEVNMIISCGYRTEKGVWGERFRVPFEEVYRQI